MSPVILCPKFRDKHRKREYRFFSCSFMADPCCCPYVYASALCHQNVNASLALFTRSFLSSTLFIFSSQLNRMEKSNWDLKNYLNYTNLQVTLLMLATSALHCQSLLVLSFTGYELFSFIFFFFHFYLVQTFICYYGQSL